MDVLVIAANFGVAFGTIALAWVTWRMARATEAILTGSRRAILVPSASAKPLYDFQFIDVHVGGHVGVFSISAISDPQRRWSAA